jgi:flagellar biosynthetic protein FliP
VSSLRGTQDPPAGTTSSLRLIRARIADEWARSPWASLLRASHRRATWATLAMLGVGLCMQLHAWAQAPAAQVPANRPPALHIAPGEAESTPNAANTANPANAPAGAPVAPALGLPPVKLELGGKGDGDAASIIQLMLVLTLLTLAPSIVIMMTPFTRIVIVLSLLRNALGTQQSPPNSVIVGLALFLSLFIMAPVLTKINDDAVKPYMAEQIGYEEALARGQAPLRSFMLNQTRDKDLALFVDLAKLDVDKVTVDTVPMTTVIPAFMISELKTAFQLGFVIYLPFLVVDMVVASILMSMGMLMLPPVLISLPFKLLMFVLSDGWNMIFGSLVRSFRM